MQRGKHHSLLGASGGGGGHDTLGEHWTLLSEKITVFGRAEGKVNMKTGLVSKTEARKTGNTTGSGCGTLPGSAKKNGVGCEKVL